MDDAGGLIYGLELQARALTPQYGEGNEVRFLIATNSLKPTNQVHLLEYNEERANIKSKIFEHSLGEVWKLNSSPHDSSLLATCYNAQKGAQVQTLAALLTLPTDLEEQDVKTEFLQWDNVELLNTEKFGERVKTVEFHPSQKQTLACVVDGKVVIFDRTESQTRVVAEVAGANAKSTPPYTTGKWSQHHQGNQFITLQDCTMRSYDVRDTQHCAWSIEETHAQMVRDVDCNPNKQCHIVTGGDDGCIKIWDCRLPKEPVFTRNDHSHWVWSVRFNTFHDQLILSSSSDCKVILTCAGSVSSEAAIVSNPEQEIFTSPDNLGDERKKLLSDGLLQSFDQHEDSVYCVEWSNVDPWVFASLSYDGRALISRVPKQYKYQIIF
ncbi:EARP and GARP complex-interacting protein 1 [Teleopsis dalmanni]|uniref:EARP and GARP complex-interacting protein 1 n=1 Tax=Teleopsis dalmanni TaxID=139649 RepID=UPI0018CFA71F|nr:EARP and GARP complex-interacting protein 1 [Teleopsis dalmanni]